MFNGQLFLTAKETAERFCVNRRTVIKWCSRHRPKKAPDLQPLRGPSGRLYFRKGHIDALLESFFGGTVSETTSPEAAAPQATHEGVL